MVSRAVLAMYEDVSPSQNRHCLATRASCRSRRVQARRMKWLADKVVLLLCSKARRQVKQLQLPSVILRGHSTAQTPSVASQWAAHWEHVLGQWVLLLVRQPLHGCSI